jgi:P-type Mg2+ transporter
VSWLLIRFALVMVPIVLLVNGFTKGNWLQASLFALSVAVGLTPEMLPMIVTSTLAKGAVLLSRKKVIVKQLDAIQNFGAMDVLCTDKTGTLTQDKIALARHVDCFGEPSDDVLNFAFMNSHYQTGLKSLLDRAVLEHVERRSPPWTCSSWSHFRVDSCLPTTYPMAVLPSHISLQTLAF